MRRCVERIERNATACEQKLSERTIPDPPIHLNRHTLGRLQYHLHRDSNRPARREHNHATASAVSVDDVSQPTGYAPLKLAPCFKPRRTQLASDPQRHRRLKRPLQLPIVGSRNKLRMRAQNSIGVVFVELCPL